MVYVALILLGLCFGSFVNALVWRLHEQSAPKAKRVASDKKLSILKGRSMCPTCQHELAWYDLIPIFSWSALGGKCRYCRRSISWQYPAVEALAAVLFSFSYAFWPYGFDTEGKFLFIAWLVFIVGFLALTVYDLRWMLLPDKLVYPLIGLTAAQALVRVVFFSAGLALVTEALLGVLCLSGLFYVLFQLSRGKWIGGGDVKLGVVLGVLAGGALQSLLLLFIASLLGSLASIPLMAGKQDKRHVHVPFGPFLILATFVVYLFGTALTGWYRRTFLLL